VCLTVAVRNHTSLNGFAPRRSLRTSEVCGPLGHAAAATARAEAAAPARERHEPVQAARVAPEPREAASEPAATEVVADLALDEGRQPVDPAGYLAEIDAVERLFLDVLAEEERDATGSNR